MSDDDRRAEALGALRASATERNGKLVPAWSAVARDLGIPRATLVRWWQTSHFAAPVEGELVEQAATVVQSEVQQSMREWIRGPMMRWRQMVDIVTSEKAIARLDKMHDSDPESAARTLVMVTKVLESAPVIARLGDDEGPKGGTALLDRVRAQLESMSDGRALLAAK